MRGSGCLEANKSALFLTFVCLTYQSIEHKTKTWVVHSPTVPSQCSLYDIDVVIFGFSLFDIVRTVQNVLCSTENS